MRLIRKYYMVLMLEMETSANKRLREIRKILGLEQKELAQKASLPDTSISKIERGTQEIPFKLLAFLKSQYNVSIDWVSEGIGSMFSEEAKIENPISVFEPNAHYIVNKQSGKFRDFPYVPIRARASFIESFDDESSYGALETYPVFDAEDKRFDQSIVIEVDGDSMEPYYRNGTKVLISQVAMDKWPFVSGPVVVAFDGFLVFKRIKKNYSQDSVLMLHSDNPIGSSLEVNVKDIRCIWRAERIVDSRAI